MENILKTVSAMSRRPILLVALLTFSASTDAYATDAWKTAIDSDHFILLRHALAPGTGDPANFRLDDCATQRNLSDTGRQQARRIGDLLRKHGIRQARVHTSQWCRCRETARLLDLGKATDLPALNSFYAKPAERDSRIGALREWLARDGGGGPTILVTHQVTINALTGIYPASGELVFVRLEGDSIEVEARLETD